jgi:hypothetical protein
MEERGVSVFRVTEKAMKMEAEFLSETLIKFKQIHGVVSQKGQGSEGSQSRQRVKYGHESRGTRNQE